MNERIFADRLNDMEKQRINKQYILENPKYMDELVQKIHDFSYVLEMSSKRNSSTYDNISLLYKIIDDFARDNGLFPIIHKGYIIYYLEYGNFIFSVFKKKGNTSSNYGCYESYLKKEELPYYIKFDDIKSNKEVDTGSFKTGLIGELREKIQKMHDEGFPLYSIQEIVDKILDNIEITEKQSRVK